MSERKEHIGAYEWDGARLDVEGLLERAEKAEAKLERVKALAMRLLDIRAPMPTANIIFGIVGEIKEALKDE